MRAWCGRVYLCVSLCVAGVCHCVCVLAYLVAVLLVSLLPCLFACMLACMLSCWWTCQKFMRAVVFNPFACLLACFTHNLCAHVVFGSVVHVAGLIVLLSSTIGNASTCVAQTQTRVRQFSTLQRPTKAPKDALPFLARWLSPACAQQGFVVQEAPVLLSERRKFQRVQVRSVEEAPLLCSLLSRAACT